MLFPVNGFLWWVSADHEERRNTALVAGGAELVGNRTIGGSRKFCSTCRVATQYMSKWFFRCTSESSKNRLPVALGSFIAVDSARAALTMG